MAKLNFPCMVISLVSTFEALLFLEQRIESTDA